jgi:hypothetical protein
LPRLVGLGLGLGFGLGFPARAPLGPFARSLDDGRRARWTRTLSGSLPRLYHTWPSRPSPDAVRSWSTLCDLGNDGPPSRANLARSLALVLALAPATCTLALSPTCSTSRALSQGSPSISSPPLPPSTDGPIDRGCRATALCALCLAPPVSRHSMATMGSNATSGTMGSNTTFGRERKERIGVFTLSLLGQDHPRLLSMGSNSTLGHERERIYIFFHPSLTRP